VTTQIALVLGILLAALVLLVTERVRMDVVALLVLGTLAVTGLVTPTEALAGFSNPAVITVWAMFILSAALARTGVAEQIGRRVLRLAGSGEARIVFVIMVTSGFLSAFMNNIGVAALMLPVVMEIARRTGRPPSRLLMPLAYGCLLGGLTTLIGTPPNLLAAEALRERGLTPFEMFD
jgi:di/tricarboxylate transporter